MESNYAGVDWASEKHDVVVQNAAGEELCAGTFAHDEKGLRSLCRQLVLSLVAMLKPLIAQIKQLEREIATALKQHPDEAPKQLRRIRWDTWSGMFYSDLTSFFIILATAVTLHPAGVTNINTAAQAASALRPLAGDGAYILFALGILGVGLIGVPVLAGSAAYGVSEALGWKEGLELKATDARGFYSVIAVAVLAGLSIEFTPIDPFKALFWSAVINGVVAVPLLVVINLLASNRKVMGPFIASCGIRVLGWITAAVMGLSAAAMLLPG